MASSLNLIQAEQAFSTSEFPFARAMENRWAPAISTGWFADSLSQSAESVFATTFRKYDYRLWKYQAYVLEFRAFVQ